MTFSELFDDAAATALEDVKSGRFDLQSEKDIQAIIFHHAARKAQDLGLPLNLHAEPTKVERRPDLVFGEQEVFVECKLSKGSIGGYTDAIKKWREDIEKLRRYKSQWPMARCVFVAVDEVGYHSNPSSKNYFDPAAEQLTGKWAQLDASGRYLLAEVP